jgi:predicted RNase H-like HicB family nuclease
VKLKYPVTIFYSKEDGGYIAIAQNLSGCSAFGKTPEEALHEMTIAMKLWLDVARKDGKTVPIPAIFKTKASRHQYLPKVKPARRVAIKKVGSS